MTCPRCGHQNNEGDRFCANCGARLTPVAPPREPVAETPASPTPEIPETPVPDAQPAPQRPEPSRIPPPVTPSFAGSAPPRDEADEEWRMSSLGPPPGPKRRVWLWIVLGISAILLICCISGIVFFGFTDTGRNMLDDAVSTAEAIQTEQAN